MHGAIVAIEYFLPKRVLTTSDLSAMFPEWSVERIDSKTGISQRHVVSDNECASDLAVAAAQKLFESTSCSPDEVDYLLFCTQSPDYILPTTACLLQDRLGIPVRSGALDFNLGCSGFVYGLGLAEGLIFSGQARSVLLITAETYSKYIDEKDKISRTIFGDGAAATLIRCADVEYPIIGPFVYGTDGGGGRHLIVPNIGARHLHMDGAKIFEFAVSAVPECVRAVLHKAGMKLEDIDLFVFHQANAYLLEEIRSILGIEEERFQVTMSHCANTVSSTIPIALKHAEAESRLRRGNKVMLIGFGVGYSWAGTIISWTGLGSGL